MERYRRSDLTMIEFCRREQVSTPSFYQWRKKLEADDSAAEQQLRLAEPMFLPVVLTEPLAGSLPTLRLPGGASIELPASLAQRQLTELLTACIAATADRAAGEARE